MTPQTPLPKPMPMHVSRNRLEGSLRDTPLAKLLASCQRHMFTGTIRLMSREGAAESGLGPRAVLVLRAGFVDDAKFGATRGEDALARLSQLDDGMYELAQRLPDLSGMLGRAAQVEGEIADLPLPHLMRHVEDNALSCTITVVSGFDRGEIRYRAGEIVEVSLNGKRDDDAIVTLVEFPAARFRVSAPPLDLDIAGWPRVTREPTAPFHLEQAKPTPPEGTAPHARIADAPAAAAAAVGPAAKAVPPTPATSATSAMSIVGVALASVAGLAALYLALSALQ